MGAPNIFEDYHKLFNKNFDEIVDTLPTLSAKELDSLLMDAWMLSNQYGAKSITQKTFMNSIYGATSNAWYPLCNVNSAADITGEGRFYIRYAANGINNWFTNTWHVSDKLHELLRAYVFKHKDGSVEYDMSAHFSDVSEVAKLPPVDYVLYIDTDSIYVEFDECIKSIGYTGEPVYFIRALNELALAPLFNQILGDKVKQRNGENFLKFDLENISAVAFFSAKKKYLCALAWEESNNKVYDNPAAHLKGKGIELAQNSFTKPVLAMLKYLLSKLVTEELNNDTYHKYMHALFSKFCKLSIEEKCKYMNIDHAKYMSYITKCDADGYEWGSGALLQHKGAARHNHLLYKYPDLQQTYKFIEGKAGVYIDEQGIPFCFNPYELPHEIAPPINNALQFSKLIVAPINRLAILAGININVDIFSEYEVKAL